MEIGKVLNDFFSAIDGDGRISAAHIGVFSALLKYRIDHDWSNPIMAFSRDIMPLAKISTTVTYFKCLHDLHRLGFIRYEPSVKCNRASRIFFIENG